MDEDPPQDSLQDTSTDSQRPTGSTVPPDSIHLEDITSDNQFANLDQNVTLNSVDNINSNRRTLNFFDMDQPPPVMMSDKIDIQKLKGPNWTTWKWQIFNILDSRGLSDVLTSNLPRGSPKEVATRNIISSSLDRRKSDSL